MSVGTCALGLLALAAIVVPTCLAARVLRVRFVADWSGARAVLATSVIAIGLVVAAAQLVGTVGLLERVPLIVVLVVSSAVIIVLTRRGRPEIDSRPQGDRRTVVVVLAILAAVALPWLAHTIGSLRTGVLGYDSLDYHLPFAGRFF